MSELVLSGFQRVKKRKSYASVARPEEVYFWLGLNRSDHLLIASDLEYDSFMPRKLNRPSPPGVVLALDRLDQLANKLVKVELLLCRTQHSDVLADILGLDQIDDRKRLRTIVGRAWAETWRYADVWCNIRDDILVVEKFSKLSKNFVKGMSNVGRVTLALLRLDKQSPSNSINLFNCVADIERAAHYARHHNRKSFLRYGYTPEDFFILRLMEVFAISFGSKITFHDSKSALGSEKSPARFFASYLLAARNCVQYPSQHKSEDYKLRKLRRFDAITRQMKELTAGPVRKTLTEEDLFTTEIMRSLLLSHPLAEARLREVAPEVFRDHAIAHFHMEQLPGLGYARD